MSVSGENPGATNGDDGGQSSLLAPTSLQGAYVQPTGTEYRLTWQDNSDSETGFEIEREIGVGLGLGLGLGLSGGFSRLHTAAPNTTQYVTRFYKDDAYSFRVRAIGSSAASDYSNTLSVSSPKRTPRDPERVPTRPVVSYEVGAETFPPTFVLHWTPSDFRGEVDGCGYEIFERFDTGPGMKPPWDTVPTASVDSGATRLEVEANAPTEYAVAAFNSYGESEYATIVIDPDGSQP